MNAFSVQDLNSVTLEDGDNGPNKVSGETDHRENKERQCRNNLERFSVHDLFRRRLYNRHVRMGAFVRAGAHGPTELVKRTPELRVGTAVRSKAAHLGWRRKR